MKLQNSIVARVHEIALKGKNRPMFFARLVSNIKAALSSVAATKVRKIHMGVEILLEDEELWPDVRDKLKDVFGIVKFYRCFRVPSSIDLIKEFLMNELANIEFETFRITAKRGYKNFPMTSLEINKDLGSFVDKNFSALVDLHHPELNIFVEIQHRETLIYYEEEAGPGGLPVGVSGNVVALLSGGIDSPVAASKVMKRGCEVTFVHFHSFPLVDGTSREKAIELVELLNRYQKEATLFLVPFADVQRDIILSVPPAYRVVIYRRFMLRIAEAIANKLGAKALVTGESVGQVGSQTLENIATIRSVASSPILSPLIGMDKQEIVEEARRIGTFPISIIPDEDCCTLFVPKHPVIRSNLKDVEAMESSLDLDRLVETAVSMAEVRKVIA